MENKQFNSLCIFCYKVVSPININNFGDLRFPEKFVRLFLRYLEISSDVKGKKMSAEKLSFCDDCTKLCVLFCELFSQLESVRLQLDWKIRQIYETMNCAANTEDELFHNPTIISNNIQKLRKNIMEQCKLKLMATQPKIFLKRCLYNSELAIKELEPSSQQLELLEEFDEVASHTDDNIDIIGKLMTFIAILHLSLPLHPSSNTDRSCGVIHEDLNPMTETNNTAGIEVQLPCDAILSQNYPDLDTKTVGNLEAQNPDELQCAVNTSFQNQEEISVALHQHPPTLNSNVSTQLMSQKCKICDASFPHPLQLRTHMKLVHNLLVPFECQICGKGLKSLYRFRYHMFSVHRTTSGIPGTIKCSFCQERFDKVKRLKTHISDFHQSYKCEQCSKTFETNIKLYQHKYDAHSKKHRSCGQCGKVFWTRKRLEDHLRIHSNIKLHNSSVSAHVSSEPNQQKIVSPDKNVANSFESLPQAPILQKQSTSMQQHVQTTQNLERMNASKVATCHLCRASFLLQKHLKYHLKTAHKETEWKYVCGVDGCEKRYRQISHLYRHKITHSKKLPFPCDYCDKSFSQRCNMRSHAIKIHGIAVPKLKKPNSFEQTPNAESTVVELPTQPLQMNFNNTTYAEREVGVPSWGQVQPEVCNGVESMTHYQSGYSNGLNPGINFTFPGANNPSSAITQQYDYATMVNAGMFNPASSNGNSTLQYYD